VAAEVSFAQGLTPRLVSDEAMRLALRLLHVDAFQVGQQWKEAPCGKLTKDALYVHLTGLAHLPPILRIFEGCCTRFYWRG
jgi:hypothetical protein